MVIYCGPVIDPGFGQEGIGVNHIGRGPDAFLIALLVQARIFLPLSYRGFRGPDAVHSLFDLEVGVLDVQADLLSYILLCSCNCSTLSLAWETAAFVSNPAKMFQFMPKMTNHWLLCSRVLFT